MKAIETKYKGYRFRSRLEARWAVFFDALGIDWEYEPEGFDLGDAGWYLPDFWIPIPNHQHQNAGYWVEIKAKGMLNQNEKQKAISLGAGKDHVLILEGSPWPGKCRLHRTGRWEGLKESSAFLDDEKDVDFLRFYNPYPCGSALIRYKKSELYIHADWVGAAIKARSARFEHGETP